MSDVTHPPEPPPCAIGHTDGQVPVERDEDCQPDGGGVRYQVNRPEIGNDGEVHVMVTVQEASVGIDVRQDVERYGGD